ncbi:MAG: efflux RND transporter permease subunit [Candidatus Poribacteria bacterium]
MIRLIAASISHKLLVIILVSLAVFLGVFGLLSLSTDLLPDLNLPVITVVASNPGLTPQDMETLITRPLESALRNLPRVVRVRSTTAFGISSVTVEFRWGVDYYFARQLVSQQLATVAPRFPQGTYPPVLVASSRLTELIQYYIEGKAPPMQKRELADYLLKYLVQSVPGVSNVINLGGEVRQYQVLLDMDELKKHSISIDDVEETLKENNVTFTGGIITRGPVEMGVRGLGKIASLDELRRVVVATRDGFPVFLRDVAEIREGPAFRRGVALANGKETVAVTITKQYGMDSMPIIHKLKEALKEASDYLPKGVRPHIYFDQSKLIEVSYKNLRDALMIGGVAVILIILLFLGNLRATLVTAVTIPLSVVISFAFMKLFHLTINTMSLGGIAVGLGTMIDASIIVTENIYRHMRGGDEEPQEAAVKGGYEMGHPAIFATLIIIAVFAPIMFLGGFEGRIFSPFAFTLIAIMFIGLTLSLVLTPMLAYTLLRRLARRGFSRESLLTRACDRLYTPLLRRSLAHPFWTLAIVLLAVGGTVVIAPFLKFEVLPSMDEGAVLVKVYTPPETSLAESVKIANQVTSVIRTVPDVAETIQQTGRAETTEAAEIENVNMSEIHVQLAPWGKRTLPISKIVELMRQKTSEIPGVVVMFSTPLMERIEESLAGVPTALSVKIFGPDLDILAQKGKELRDVMSKMPGVADLRLEQIGGAPQLVVQVDRERAGRYGLSPSKIGEMVEAAMDGEVVTTVFRRQKEYGVLLQLQERFRNSPEKLKRLLVDAPGGTKIPLAAVANIYTAIGPSTIYRENMLRNALIDCDVEGRSLSSVVNDIKSKVKKLSLPGGYFVRFGGRYERQQTLIKRMLLVLVISTLVVFVLLLSAFNSVKHALLIIFTVPMALIGGIWALFITGSALNVSSMIGLMAHFGLSVQKGVILVAYINQLRGEGVPFGEALFRGGRTRMRPVLMTATTTALGVLPLALGLGAGAEMYRPMAIVLIGGLITSTLLTLVALPSFYGIVERRRQ